jgi:hypothetical protein
MPQGRARLDLLLGGLNHERKGGVEDALGGLIPHVHPKLARHVPVCFSVGGHGRERIPHLLADRIHIFKLDTLIVGYEPAVVNVKKITRRTL